MKTPSSLWIDDPAMQGRISTSGSGIVRPTGKTAADIQREQLIPASVGGLRTTSRALGNRLKSVALAMV